MGWTDDKIMKLFPYRDSAGKLLFRGVHCGDTCADNGHHGGEDGDLVFKFYPYRDTNGRLMVRGAGPQTIRYDTTDCDESWSGHDAVIIYGFPFRGTDGKLYARTWTQCEYCQVCYEGVYASSTLHCERRDVDYGDDTFSVLIEGYGNTSDPDCNIISANVTVAKTAPTLTCDSALTGGGCYGAWDCGYYSTLFGSGSSNHARFLSRWFGTGDASSSNSCYNSVSVCIKTFCIHDDDVPSGLGTNPDTTCDWRYFMNVQACINYGTGQGSPPCDCCHTEERCDCFVHCEELAKAERCCPPAGSYTLYCHNNVIQCGCTLLASWTDNCTAV